MEQLERSGKYKMFQIVGSYWIGSVYAETGHLEEAFELFQKGLHVDYPRGLESMAARLTNGIAGVYMKEKKYSLALEYYQKALDLCSSTTEVTFKARGLTDLADYLRQDGQLPGIHSLQRGGAGDTKGNENSECRHHQSHEPG
jgi:tetratricopeptide (TPR) repeat protein